MRRSVALLLAGTLQCSGPAGADDTDAYVHDGGYQGVYAHIVMDLGDKAQDTTLCTYGVDCGPPFTTAAAHRHLGSRYRDGEGVTAPGMFRAVLAAVIDDTRLDDLRLSLLIPNHADNPVLGSPPGVGGGTILLGYRHLADQRAEVQRTLSSIPLPAGPAAHALQPRETFLEWLRYIAGGSVALGQNTQGNFGSAHPAPDFDGGIIGDGRYLTPFSERNACPRLFSLLLVLSAPQRDGDQDAALAAQLGLPGQTSFEQLVAYLHADTTDLLPQVRARVALRRTWVVTSRAHAAQAQAQELAAAGGGAVFYVDDPLQLQQDLSLALAEGLASGSHPLDVVPVEDSFHPGQVLDDVFIPLFSPRANTRWPGNLKKLKLHRAPGGGTGRFDQLVDAHGLPAIETSGDAKGQLRFDALTFWTDVASLLPGDGRSVPAEADGRVVDRGGAGQKIDGFAKYAAAPDGLVAYFIGDTNTDAPVEGYGPRQLYFDASGGDALQPLDASPETLAALRPLLDPAHERTDDALLETIRWARGQDTAADSPAARSWLLGEVLHSRPLPLNYGATPGYSRANPNIRLFFGSGDGVFHGVENTHTDGSQSGREVFGFYPREQLAALARRRMAPPPAQVRQYGVDGAPVLMRHDRNRDGTLDHTDGDTAWVYVGLRRGGASYYAFDVSNPDAVPRLMWRLSPTAGGAFDALGMTFSTPVAGRINASGVPEEVLIFGGGYHGGWNEDASARIGKDLGAADDRIGNAIYIVNARTGELVWKAAYGTTGVSTNTHYEHAGLVDSIPSPVAAMSTPDGVIHRLYVGDTGGAVWRVDLPPGAGDVNHRRDYWFITKLADLGADAAESGGARADDRRFFHAPEIVRSFDGEGAFDGVLLQSGDREQPNETQVENALFYLRDRYTESGSERVRQENDTRLPAGRIQYAELMDRTACESGDPAVESGEDESGCSEGGAQGWKLRYDQRGEKGASTVMVDGGRVFASTFVPGNAAACPAAAGRGRLHVVRLTDAAAVANQQRTYDLGEGIPGPVELIGETLLLPGSGADLYDLDGDGVRDQTRLLPSQAVQRYRTYWREPGVDPL